MFTFPRGIFGSQAKEVVEAATSGKGTWLDPDNCPGNPLTSLRRHHKEQSDEIDGTWIC